MLKPTGSNNGVIYFDLHFSFLVYMAHSNNLGCIFLEHTMSFGSNFSLKVTVGTWGTPRRIPEMLINTFSTGNSTQQSIIWEKKKRKKGKKKKR